MKKALIVDDTKNIRNLLKTCLELNGYHAVATNNGHEALELLKNETFDLIFLDIKMPELSGTEVLRRIRQIGLNVPVIIMTAFATVKNAVECTKLGAFTYLQKPFTADKVKGILMEFDRIYNSDRSIIDSYLENVQSYISQNNLDEALKTLKIALSEDINRGEIYYLIGKVYDLKGEYLYSKRFYNMAKLFE